MVSATEGDGGVDEVEEGGGIDEDGEVGGEPEREGVEQSGEELECVEEEEVGQSVRGQDGRRRGRRKRSVLRRGSSSRSGDRRKRSVLRRRAGGGGDRERAGASGDSF